MKYFYALVLLFLVFGTKAQNRTILVDGEPYLGATNEVNGLTFIYRDQVNLSCTSVPKNQDDEYCYIYLGTETTLRSKQHPHQPLYWVHAKYDRNKRILGYYKIVNGYLTLIPVEYPNK